MKKLNNQQTLAVSGGFGSKNCDKEVKKAVSDTLIKVREGLTNTGDYINESLSGLSKKVDELVQQNE